VADDLIGPSEAFLAVATGIFVLAILHTFAAASLTSWSHRLQARGAPPAAVRVLHVLGEVELVFALWAVVLTVAMAAWFSPAFAARYLGSVTYTEAVFVVVVMTLASTRPIVALAEGMLARVAGAAGGSPAAWWVAILILAPLLGSLITEPAAMTIAALLLVRQFYRLGPSSRLAYATLGLLFVNVSIGGTLTHFAAPPILMVSRPWGWGTPYMLSHFGLRAVLAVVVSTGLYYALFRTELRALRPAQPDEVDAARAHVPMWITSVHLLFLAFTVVYAHEPQLFIAGFAVFLVFTRMTPRYQGALQFRAALMVGVFLAGLVIHGGWQRWWIAPLLSSLDAGALFAGATFLTSFNDNALITYLATLVPNLSPEMKAAVVEGAVTGGGLTVIANAPNPAGQALLGRYFDDAVSPLRLFLGAVVPTAVAAAAFRLL
jgi:hypothetical protein